jgi:hypothetical protein
MTETCFSFIGQAADGRERKLIVDGGRIMRLEATMD